MKNFNNLTNKTELTRCTIQYVDFGDIQEVTISSDEEYIDECDYCDDDIFFYGLSREDLIKGMLVHAVFEGEWRVIEVEGCEDIVSYEEIDSWKPELAEWIGRQVAYYKDDEDGCSTWKIDNHLAVCIGWSNGFDPEDPSVIHSKSNPTWGVVIGIKVWTSDDLQTDFDWINAPYYSDGSIAAEDMSIEPSDDPMYLATLMLEDYKSLQFYTIDDKGLIL